MGTYYGKISGIGNPTERINEITADDLATLRHFQLGWDYGVINKNLLRTDTVLLNKEILNSEVVDAEGWYVSDFINVSANEIYSKNLSGIAILTYDTNKNLIGRESFKNNLWQNTNSNVKYIKINGLISELNSTKVTGSSFNGIIANNKLVMNSGVFFAYGYVGFVDKCELEFIRPAIPQYHIIYAELDRSKIPNTCTLKVKNNQSSTSIERTFRQDYLDKVRTGLFQLPLWRVKVGANGIEEVVDLRALKDKPKQVEYAPYCKSVFGSIAPSVTATTQPIADDSKKIATTEFVHLATRDYIDN